MSISKRKDKKGLSITVKESLTKFEVSDYREKLMNYIDDADVDSVRVSFNDVTECDTSGLQLIFSLYKTLVSKSCSRIEFSFSDAVEKAASRNAVDLGRHLKPIGT